MAGRPTRRAAAGKKPGERAQEQREAALTAVVSLGTQKGRGKAKDSESSITQADLSNNPVWQAYEERRLANLAKMQAEGAEWRKGLELSYSKQQVMDVLELVCHGYNTIEAAQMLGLNYSAVTMAIRRDQELTRRHQEARELYAHERVKLAAKIAQEEQDPARARIITDLIKWEVSKVLPKFYGDKITHEAGEGITFSMNIGQSATKKGRQAVK